MPCHPSNANSIKGSESEGKRSKHGNYCRGCGLYFHEVCHVIWHTTLIFSDRRSEETCPCKERTKADDIMDELEKEHKTMLDSKKDKLAEVEKEGETKDEDDNNK
mgnify:FL=1